MTYKRFLPLAAAALLLAGCAVNPAAPAEVDGLAPAYDGGGMAGSGGRDGSGGDTTPTDSTGFGGGMAGSGG